jgi:diguanylate cyclase
MTQARRLGQPLSLILTDIDHFKSVNDRFGHPFGDEVLAFFATILSSRRTTDIACRYGGEEFAIILPEIAAREALEIAEEMRIRFEQHRWRRHPDLVLTASFGVADLSMVEATATPQDLVARTDLALYGAKRSGRNRVSTDGVPLAA